MPDEPDLPEQQPDLLTTAKAILAMNDRGGYTQPAPGLYPHQWLWDSCFIAIGLRHIDLDRAQTELMSLARGQWHNGMLPCIIFRDDPQYRIDRNVWRSWLSPYAPDDISTTGITQPPMLAEAVVQVGAKMAWPERRRWYKMMYPCILAYHQWLYKDRDPHGEGLVLQVHPWETGMENTPPWMAELNDHLLPLWIRIIDKFKLSWFINLFRRDTTKVPSEQRHKAVEAAALYDIQRRLRRKAYDTTKVLDHAMFAIEDLAFNSILVRANGHLRDIAKGIREDLPDELTASMKKTEQTFDELWDPYSSQYYSRDFITHRLLKIPTIATLLPLYAGNISKERAELLVKQIENEHSFGPAYPVPSVPMNSFWFHQKGYWQGPTWVNMNWVLIEGLKRYGFKDHAAALRESTVEMVQKSGCYEYFDPLTGEGIGIKDFSWTAALTIDLIKQK
jgi:hypothetical protein